MLLVYLLGRTLFTRRAALLASGMWLSTFRFVMYARQGLTDVPVLCFVLAAMLGFTRAVLGADPRWGVGGLGRRGSRHSHERPHRAPAVPGDYGLARGLARLAQHRSAPVGVGRLVGGWYRSTLVSRRDRPARMAVRRAPLRIRGHDTRRIVRVRRSHPGALFYLQILPGEIVPWTLLVAAALVWAALTWRRMSTDDRTRFALLAVWSVGVMALFSAARYKLPHYTLPAYPPLLIAAGAFVDAMAAGVGGWSRVQRGTLVATAGVVALVCAAVAVLLCLLFPFDMVGTALLALLAVGAGIAGLQCGRHSTALGAVVCIAALLYPVVAWRWSDEVSGHFQAAQALGKVAARSRRPVPRSTSTLLHPSLVHYARRPVDVLQGSKEVARFLAEPSRRYLVLSCRDVKATIDSTGTPLQVVARQPVLPPRLRHLLDGRMMTPANELCLVIGRHR